MASDDFRQERPAPTTDEEKAAVVAAGAAKFDGEKPPLELLSSIALFATARILAFGAKKYRAHNWRGGFAWSRLIGAILRHALAFASGEDLDPESGEPHVDHLACMVMFLQEHYRTRKDLDDRWRPTKDYVRTDEITPHAHKLDVVKVGAK